MPTYETANEFLHPTYLEMYNSSARFMWLFFKTIQGYVWGKELGNGYLYTREAIVWGT